MESITTIGIDLAKNVFQVHGANAAGVGVLKKTLRRPKLLAFLAGLPSCVVAMEACSGAHYWAREIERLGHKARLIPPIYVKPFVKRQKNDAADAEAICEAAQRPNMRFVEPKSEDKQALGIVFRVRSIMVRQRTQSINALRGLAAEFGIVVPQGPSHIAKLISIVKDVDAPLPRTARDALLELADQLERFDQQIANFDHEISARAKTDATARRLMTIPGVGPQIAAAIVALAPAAETFRSGRDFAAWMGLTPLQKSTGGKTKLGATSKMGNRTLRRLLVIGGSAVVRWARRKGAPAGSWLARMIARKPVMVVSVAYANKLARVIWALLTKGGVYRAPVAAIA
jgi:transposase